MTTPRPEQLKGRPELVKQVREIMEPVGRMDGDSLPVSAFVDYADGQWEQGAAAYEKRGVAVSVAEVERRKLHPVQQLLVRVPACHASARSP